jgi:formylglycine-generating enzyme required for sulfatase activity
MRPVEKVCYNQIRNSGSTTANEGYEWPVAPYDNSVLGKLRKKTGIDFDLPSDAEWEFACRAGNGEGLWNDGSTYISSSSDSHLDRLSRNKRNVGSATTSSDASAGTAIVGSYSPNSWGLYDMHGNVGEWCLDWYKEDLSGTDGSVVTVNTENNRVRRSGLANDNIYRLRSAARAPNAPTLQNLYIGLRLACRAGL